MDETALPDPLLSKRRRRLALLACVVFLLLAGAVLIIRMLLLPSEQELRAALAEADRLDPGWRLEELEARRRQVPDEENSALLIIAIDHVPDVGWQWGNIAPTASLEAQYTAALRATLTQYNDQLPQARKLANLPSGRFPADHFGGQPTANLSALIPLLQWDAVLRAQDGDTDGALESLRAALNTGRSVGDEPSFPSQVSRAWSWLRVVQGLRRVLAQGEPSEPALAAFQRLLEDEATESPALGALRGLRAHENQELTRFASEKAAEFGPSLQGAMTPIMGPVQVKHSHARCVGFLTKLIEIAKLPPEQQEEALQQLPALPQRKDVPYVDFDFQLLPDLMVTCLRTLAEERSAVVGLALERYRRAQGHWPDTLADLVPTYLPQVPLDPFTGKELSYRRLDDGVVVYSVGPSGPLKGANAYLPVGVPGADKGFRLWDVDKRRQPPAPPPVGGATPRDK
jgi:hypothetical protein